MRALDRLGVSALMLGLGFAMILVPDVTRVLLVDPTFSAVLGTLAVATLVVVLRATGPRGSLLERRMFVLFLASMPMVYLSSWLRHGGSSTWLGVELAGQLVFAVIAWLGARRPMVLAGGIVAHGVLWDSWHFGRTPFMPDWYAVACLLVDVGFGLYVATQARAYAAARHRDTHLAR